jgi:peptidoglycan hydrolase CwlO-like protein
MKLTIFLLGMILFIASGPLVSYSAENERASSSRQQLQEKKNYEINMEERLARLGKQLDEINVKAKDMKEQARKEMTKYLDDAKKKQKAALRKLQKIQKESTEKWKRFTSDMDAAADSFAKAYEKVKSYVKD